MGKCISRLQIISAVTVGAVAFNVLLGFAKESGPQQEAPYILYLKSGGNFTHWAVVSDKNDYDRAVNCKNITTIRKINKDTILIDGNINVKFDGETERAKFLEGWGNQWQTDQAKQTRGK